MIRAAVRTITLNIFAVNDDQMQDFILDKKAAPYFSNLVYFIANHASILNDISNSSSYYKQYSRFNYYMAEHCDNFYYINDIINLDIEKMNNTLTAHLMDLLVQPIYADSLVKEELLPSKQVINTGCPCPSLSRITYLSPYSTGHIGGRNVILELSGHDGLL
ncbi:7213_t:CDS:2 [Acaulospora colombiana]|uniref:7213_t:CDS:1 n=1 Tax=Acaulospora colombiana TaxID=27376 RepID=A0ACA9K0Z8_9GLOM|nr:7213_t:CDS:2 [Acaulospora colombiana]